MPHPDRIGPPPPTDADTVGMMKPNDIGTLASVGAVRLSPDGGLVAYTVVRIDLDGNRYREQIWLAPTVGGAAPEPFSSGKDRDRYPEWSPDGRRLAYITNEPGVTETTVWIAPLGTGSPVPLTTFSDAVTALAWSPDGTWLAVTARTPDPRFTGEVSRQPPRRIERFFSRLDTVGWLHGRHAHIHLVATDGSGEQRDLTPGEFEHEGAAWSPDGRTVVFSAARHDRWDLDLANDIYAADVESGQLRVLTDGDGIYHGPVVSPDGRRVVFVGAENPETTPHNNQPGVLDLESGKRIWFGTDLDRTFEPYPSPGAPVWCSDDRLLVAVEDRGNLHLYEVTADGESSPALVVGGERTVTAFDANASIVAFAATQTNRPSELIVHSSDGERTVTDVAGRFVTRCRPQPAERFTAVSPDGAEVDAWIVTPPGLDATRRYPVLLNVHGGPFTQTGNRFFDEAQIQAAAGYVVLLSNPRGSSGRDTAWGRAICGPNDRFDPGTGWGSVDADDVMAVLDTALERFPFIDGDRAGLLGGSYGGYMTSWIVGHSNRFKAACSERAVNNLLSLEWNSDIGTMFRTEIGVSHLDDPAEYLRQSPITYVRDIVTPLLILHSEDDLRCPITQAEEFFVALRSLGKDVEFYRFPGESHELSRSGSPVHRVQRAEIILEFFDRHLGNIA
jgi:dipeptidyl aminopeptidase/acylaminoacyl peptidase